MLRRVVWLSSILIVLLNVGAAPVSAQTETIDELYKKALKEDGVLNCYCSLAQINAEKIYPVFEKRFPGIKINHVDATSDKLSARAITEARGGKTFGRRRIRVGRHQQDLRARTNLGKGSTGGGRLSS